MTDPAPAPGGPLRVLVAGPRAGAHGGIGSVQAHLEEATATADTAVVLTPVCTYSDDGSRPRQVVTMIGGLARAAVVLLRGDVDVVHLHVSQRLSVLRKGLLRLLAAARGVPVVLHCHGSEFRDWFDALPAPGRAIVRRLLRAERLVVLSELLREEYARRLRIPRATTVALPNPVAWPAQVDPPPVADRVVVAFLGRFGLRKGIDDVLAALALLDPAVRDRVRLVAAGDGEVERITSEVARLGLGDVVTISPWLAPDERDRLLGSASLLVLPSRNEGLPMSVLEAMAHAVVPVVTAVGGLADLVRDGENGRLVPVGDPAALTRVLTELVGDPGIRARLGARAREDVRPYAASAWADALVRIWREVAQAPKVPSADNRR